MAEVLRTVGVTGFDPDSEPSIQEMSDGSLEISFEFMPPSDVERQGPAGLGEFANLDQEIAAAAGVPVVWEDREFFRIESIRPAPWNVCKRSLTRARILPRPNLDIKKRPTDVIVDSNGGWQACS